MKTIYYFWAKSYFEVLGKKFSFAAKNLDMSDSVLLSHVLSVLIPESLSSFDFVLVKEHPAYIELRLEDSADRVLEALQDSQTVVLDGFCNPS
jgi:hypothetical protein